MTCSVIRSAKVSSWRHMRYCCIITLYVTYVCTVHTVYAYTHVHIICISGVSNVLECVANPCGVFLRSPTQEARYCSAEK